MRNPYWSLLALLISLAATPALAQETVRAPIGPDPYRGYTAAADHFCQKAWIGKSGGTLERITLRLGERRSGLSLELPNGSATEHEAYLTRLVRAQGWDPGLPRTMKTDNGPVYTFRAPRVSAPAWNEFELRLDLDPLVKGLEDIGGKPRLFAVRTPEALEWTASPPPSATGVFEGERYAFYTLKSSSNSALMLRGNIQPRRMLALVSTAVLWLLFPLLASGLARAFAGPADGEADPEIRWKRWRQALCWATGIGAYATFSFQGETLRLVPLLIPRLPAEVVSFGSMSIPLGFLYYYWGIAAWRLAGPSAPKFLSTGTLKTLGAAAAFLLFYGVLFSGIQTRDPFSGLGRMTGSLVALLGLFFLGTWFWIERKTRKVASEITSPPPIPPGDSERRERLREMAEKADPPEELAGGEKAIAECAPEMRPMLEVLQSLTPEEKSWLAVGHQLAFQKSGRMGMPVLKVLPISGGILIAAGLAAWVLPGVLGVILSLGATFAVVPLFKHAGANMHSEFTRSGVDLAVAKLVDDPQRYLEVLRRLEAATADVKGVGETYRARTKALERALRS